jgi:biopolymer transport protein ExbD
MKFISRKRTRPHIDMTPLIDCVFTLLVVLMLSATFNSPDSIDLTLPQAATRDQEANLEITLTVDNAGKHILNNEAIDPEQLVARLRPLIEKSRDKVVTFRGDEKLDYKAFVKALDAVRSAGALHVNILHK